MELLVAMGVLLIIMAIVFSLTLETSNAWKNTTGKIEGFRNSRAAFEAMTRTLSQATLNTYYDYVDVNGNFRGSGMSSGTITTSFVPYSYARQSELHFICGPGSTLLPGMSGYTPVTQSVFFQAPLGETTNALYNVLDQTLNACGFYVIYGPDPTIPSYLNSSAATRYRYRLMQFVQDTSSFGVYATSTTVNPTAWFTNSILPTPSTSANYVLAENVVALVLWPKLSEGDQTAANALTANYSYNSRNGVAFSPTNNPGYPTDTQAEWSVKFNQLPPVVEVTMVAIDEASALKLGNTPAPPNSKVGLTSTLFTSATYPTSGQNQLEIDLAAMENTLIANHINFHVYQTEVSIRSAKWTTK